MVSKAHMCSDKEGMFIRNVSRYIVVRHTNRHHPAQ